MKVPVIPMTVSALFCVVKHSFKQLTSPALHVHVTPRQRGKFVKATLRNLKFLKVAFTNFRGPTRNGDDSTSRRRLRG